MDLVYEQPEEQACCPCFKCKGVRPGSQEPSGPNGQLQLSPFVFPTDLSSAFWNPSSSGDPVHALSAHHNKVSQAKQMPLGDYRPLGRGRRVPTVTDSSLRPAKRHVA